MLSRYQLLPISFFPGFFERACDVLLTVVLFVSLALISFEKYPPSFVRKSLFVSFNSSSIYNYLFISAGYIVKNNTRRGTKYMILKCAFDLRCNQSLYHHHRTNTTMMYTVYRRRGSVIRVKCTLSLSIETERC